jgi:hypothetical protein
MMVPPPFGAAATSSHTVRAYGTRLRTAGVEPAIPLEYLPWGLDGGHATLKTQPLRGGVWPMPRSPTDRSDQRTGTMDLAGSWPAGNAVSSPGPSGAAAERPGTGRAGSLRTSSAGARVEFGGEIQADLESVIDPDNEGDSVVTGRSEKLDHELAGFAEIGPDGRESGPSAR